jgi:acyl-CoA reductase-like NAD-dependent aldehyde dehydrogenase
MKIMNPATQELLRELNEDTLDPVTGTIVRKYSLARAAQSSWAARSITDRVACIQRFHDLLEKHEAELARDLTLEVGKPLQEAHNELNGARNRIRYFIQKSEDTLRPLHQRTDGSTEEWLSFDPLGVIANISAWNYPYLVGVNVFIPALIGGNAVLYKPSEFSTLTGLHIERLLHQAGIPLEIFRAVIGDHRAGEALLDLPLDGYFFTGSYKTGKHIAERVSGKLVPVGLELGGKDPLYVTDEVQDLAQVANAVAEGCFYNNGQSCCAVERVYVHAGVYDRFIELLEAETRKLKVGNPLDRGFQQGSLTRPAHVAFLESQIEEALRKGATLLCGGKRPPGMSGAFFEPTVLSNVTHSMRVMTEESFGPVIGVMKVQSDDEAVNLMNDCEYGLTAAVYSSNRERARGLLARVNTGTSYWNCCDRVSPYLPWAGRKHSGMGATLSHLGILAFVRPRGWHLRG